MKISLDLLPPIKKIQLKRDSLFREILREGTAFLVPLLMLIVILANIFYLLKIQQDSEIKFYESRFDQARDQELDKYNKDFKQINESANSLIKIQDGHLHWSRVLELLSQLVPAEVVINNFATKNYNLYLTGKAKSREGLLKFKNNLENNKCFENVNVPLSDLVVKDNVNFQLDFNVKESCLKGD